MMMSAIIGGALAASAVSNAAVLASWDVWTDGTFPDYDADTELAGFQGTITTIDPNNRVLSPYGSSDGTFGAVSGADATDTRSLMIRSSDAPAQGPKGYNVVTISVTNGTASAYSIDSIHFDIGVRGTVPNESGDSYTLEYTSGGLGPSGTSIGSAAGITLVGNVGNADDFDITLASFLGDTTLGIGETAVFTLTIDSYGSISASSTLDNVLFQGTAIPEPAVATLSLLGVLGLLCRRRH